MPATRSQTRRGGGRKAAAAPRRRAAVAAAQAPASHKKRSSQGQEPELQGAQTRSKKKRLEASEPPPSQGRGRGGAGSAAHECIAINRAPVLNLWVAVVAQRQGYSFEEGLTFGRWVSGTLAQSKGRSLGIFEAKEVSEEEKAAKRRRDEALGVRRLDVFGMHVPSVECDGRQVAVSQGKPIDPSGTEAYLQRAFGAAPLAAARAAMEELAESIPEGEIGRAAYKLYEQFRPEWHGWGQKGTLDLGAVRGLAATWCRHEG